MEYSQFDRRPAYASADRRSQADRRDGLRRGTDRTQRMREFAAFAISLCGGLAVLFIFFVIIGTIDVGDAAAATGVAILFALIWLYFFWNRTKSDALRIQRPDRERRGF